MIIDTVEGLNAFQLLQWKYAMKIQYDTGLKYSRGSVPKFVAEKFGMKYRTKKDIPALIAECDARLLIIEHKMKRHHHVPECRACIEMGPVRGI